jgi:NAD dependent epimerase/dehydratase family enzyme
VNVVSPNPVTNAEFTKSLAKALNRPAILPIPAVAAKLVLGELADETLLASARVQARKLIDSGFEFRFPELATALKHLLQ